MIKKFFKALFKGLVMLSLLIIGMFSGLVFLTMIFYLTATGHYYSIIGIFLTLLLSLFTMVAYTDMDLK